MGWPGGALGRVQGWGRGKRHIKWSLLAEELLGYHRHLCLLLVEALTMPASQAGDPCGLSSGCWRPVWGGSWPGVSMVVAEQHVAASPACPVLLAPREEGGGRGQQQISYEG